MSGRMAWPAGKVADGSWEEQVLAGSSSRQLVLSPPAGDPEGPGELQITTYTVISVYYSLHLYNNIPE